MRSPEKEIFLKHKIEINIDENDEHSENVPLRRKFPKLISLFILIFIAVLPYGLIIFVSLPNKYKGVLCSLSGNIMIPLGDNLKLLSDKNNTKKFIVYNKNNIGNTRNVLLNIIKEYSKNILSILGVIVSIFGQISNAYGLTLAPQTLAAIIGATQFISQLLCSWIFHNEILYLKLFIGVSSIIFGCLTMIFIFKSNNKNEPDYTLDILYSQYHGFSYKLYLFFVGLSLVLYYSQKKYCLNTENKVKYRGSIEFENINNDIKKIYPCINNILGIIFSLNAAIVGTQSVVFGKSMGIIIQQLSKKNNKLTWFNAGFIFTLFIGWFVTITFWLLHRTESMSIFDINFMAPLNQIMWTSFSIISGGIYFNEFQSSTTIQWIGLISGMILTYYGLYFLVPKKLNNNVLINIDKNINNYNLLTRLHSMSSNGDNYSSDPDIESQKMSENTKAKIRKFRDGSLSVNTTLNTTLNSNAPSPKTSILYIFFIYIFILF